MIATEEPPSSAPPRPPRHPVVAAGPGEALLGAFSRSISLLRWLLAGLAGLYLCSGITRVAPHEDAVIYRLGTLLPKVHPPGLVLAFPAPIDRVVRISTRMQQELGLNAWSPDEDHPVLGAPSTSPLPVLPNSVRPPGLHPVFNGYTLTGDANLVQARFTVRYRIANPVAWISAAETTVTRAAIEATVFAAATEALAGGPVNPALGSGLDAFRLEVVQAAQARLDALRLGVELMGFDVAVITPPAATVAAFADVTNAQVEARTMVENARSHAARTLPEARSESYRLRQRADAEAREKVVRAQAEASSFLVLAAQHRTAPELVAARLRAEAVSEVLARVRARTFLPADGELNLFLRDRE